MLPEKGTVFKAILFAFLGVCCALQMHVSLEKFLSDKTTMAFYKRPQESAPLPSVILCPSKLYRQSKMKANNMTVYMHYKKFGLWPRSASEVRSAWDNITYPLPELLREVFAKVDGATCRLDVADDRCQCWNRKTKEKLENVCHFEVATIDTMYNGKCFMISLRSNVTSAENFYMIFHHAKDQDSGAPFIFLTTPSQPASVASMFWNGSPNTVMTLKRHQEMQVIMKPTETISASDTCQTDLDEAEFSQCVIHETEKNIYSEKFAKRFCDEDTFGNCTIPQISYFAPKTENTTYCEDKAAAGCAHILAKESMRNIVGGRFPGCPLPCTTQHYELSQFVLNMWPPRVKNTSRLFLYLSTTDVKVQEEYCLFDLNAIVASIGGTMGLFLGFSFLQLITCILKYISRGHPQQRIRVSYND